MSNYFTLAMIESRKRYHTFSLKNIRTERGIDETLLRSSKFKLRTLRCQNLLFELFSVFFWYILKQSLIWI